MKWLKRVCAGGIFLCLTLLLVLVVFGNSQPHSKGQIETFAKRLNEAAAINIPHHFLMSDDVRAENLTLLNKVESGLPLNQAESAAYRRLFQQTLHEGQAFLGRFDGELTVLTDVAMHKANNAGSSGIKGHHDHHDVSARRNYADVERALANLDNSSGMFGAFQRIAAINLAQKSLADIISHMGVSPHTISVPYTKPKVPWQQVEIGSTFELMMQAYKASQFAEVHGTAYWSQVDKAVLHYASLVEKVQARLWRNSAWWERRIGGRFLDYQTLSPQISPDIAMRR